MRPKAIFAVSGTLASVALTAGLVSIGPAGADGEKGDATVRAGNVVVGDGTVRAGDAVIDESGVRIEGGSSIINDEGNVSEAGSVEESGSDEEGTEEDQESTPVGEDEVVMRLKGDEGVEFSGTCSVGGEEQEIKGKVPDEFTFGLDGGELECEIRKEGGDGALKMVLVSGNDRVVQKVNGDSTLKFTYSDDGVSSSTTSSSGSSNVVSQSSSSSIVQSNSSSTSR